MLVLSRKVGERIHVGDDIVVEIRRIAGNRVTLALEAPRHVRILRGELERAAREFDVTDDDGAKEPETPYSLAAARINVTREMPSHAISRDFAI